MDNINNKLNWIRITKSAGSSFDNFIKINNLNIKEYTPTEESLKNIEIDENNTFSIVRNPYEKVFSAYKFLVYTKLGNERCNNIINKKLSFDEFLHLTFNLREKFIKHKNICLRDKNNFYPGTKEYQEYWIVSHMESSFDSINFFDNYKKIKIFILNDNLEENFKNHYKINTSKNLKRLNISNKVKKENSFNTLIENFYLDDINMWKEYTK